MFYRSARRKPAMRKDRAIKPNFEDAPVQSIALSYHDHMKPISSLPVPPALIHNLYLWGYRTLGDLTGLTALHAINIEGMNGKHWQAITSALRREQFPN